MTRLFTDGTEYVDDMVKMSLSEYIRHSFLTKDQALGNYFDYVEYMWSLRDDPNLLIIFYEDLVLVSCFHKAKQFKPYLSNIIQGNIVAS